MRPLLHLVIAAASLALSGCGGVEREQPISDAHHKADDEPHFDAIDGSFVVDDVDSERPVTFKVPPDYDPSRAYRLVLVLAGYGVTGAQFESVTGFDTFANANDLVFAFPEGRVDSDGSPFWNASDACCDFEATGVDDGAYLTDVVTAARKVAHVDSALVIGHSNGGFMAQRLACDHADAFDAVVSVSGARPNDCHPSRPIGVLETHGTADSTILYNGGNVGGGLASYPSATETAAAWSEDNGCTGAVDDPDIDLDVGVAGQETHVHRFTGCAAPTALWTSTGGEHVPNGVADYFAQLLEFLTSSP